MVKWKNSLKLKNAELVWLGHASFLIKTKQGKKLYIDPFRLESVKTKLEPADLILISHEHFDHFSEKDIQLILNTNTKLIAYKGVKEKSLNISENRFDEIGEGEEIDWEGIKLRAIPAYNPAKRFHPKGFGTGFLINIKNEYIYWAGDTDLIPEMDRLKVIGISAALLPIGGTYTMDLEEVKKANELINPKYFVPMHFNKIQGTEVKEYKLDILEKEVKNIYFLTPLS